jgi:hypothetical protein
MGRPQSRFSTESHRVLQLNEVWRPKADRPLLLTCLQGRCWVTRAGEATDYLLEAGKSITAQPRQGTVLQALEAGTVLAVTR